MAALLKMSPAALMEEYGCRRRVTGMRHEAPDAFWQRHVLVLTMAERW